MLFPRGYQSICVVFLSCCPLHIFNMWIIQNKQKALKTVIHVFYYKSVLYYKENLNITNTENNVTGLHSLGQSSLLNRHLFCCSMNSWQSAYATKKGNLKKWIKNTEWWTRNLSSFVFLTDMAFKINPPIQNKSCRKFPFPTRRLHKNVKQHSKMLKRGWSYTSHNTS